MEMPVIAQSPKSGILGWNSFQLDKTFRGGVVECRWTSPWGYVSDTQTACGGIEWRLKADFVIPGPNGAESSAPDLATRGPPRHC